MLLFTVGLITGTAAAALTIITKLIDDPSDEYPPPR